MVKLEFFAIEMLRPPTRREWGCRPPAHLAAAARSNTPQTSLATVCGKRRGGAVEADSSRHPGAARTEARARPVGAVHSCGGLSEPRPGSGRSKRPAHLEAAARRVAAAPARLVCKFCARRLRSSLRRGQATVRRMPRARPARFAAGRGAAAWRRRRGPAVRAGGCGPQRWSCPGLAPSDSVGEHGPSSHLCAAWQRKLVSVLPACVMRSRDRTVEAPGDGCGALTEFESLAHLGLKSIHCECFSLVVSSPGPARCSRGGSLSLIAAQATPGPASGPGQDGRPITVVPLSWGCRPSWRESESCDTHWQSVTASLRLPPAHPPSHTLRLASLVQVPLIRVFSKRVQQTLNYLFLK